ncbi:SdpI/YhfL protein family protein [Prauserella marina]|uniref:SdpI/YhfL protein family protein n=1 Tax=Prauserella marina TaxID=530584 RepID=A0A1G6SWD7_9PSEU|nr:SdpI/YhfL family protein [Prauserella marina]SDD20507.1 SdpI/YhfL protein family protein [Prauserella marina]
MPRILTLVFVVALIPILVGVLVGWGGFLGLRGKLPRDRGAGVRTAATLRSDEAFMVANKVAGLPTLVAGFVGVAGGAAGLAMPDTVGLVIAAVIGLVGMFALVAGGGVLGHRAASAVPAPSEPEIPAGCAGCACGGCGVLSGSANSAANPQGA